MYDPAYGIIETLAPLHIGASAGEETGNLNLIFRDQFTQTGIIPGSSIRGRFRAQMRNHDKGKTLANIWYGHTSDADGDEPENDQEKTKDRTTEALVKFEYASLVWLPVFCPGQPIVWISSPKLLKRYKQIVGLEEEVPQANKDGYPAHLKRQQKRLFFNLGFLDNLKDTPSLTKWIPKEINDKPDNLVVVSDLDISIIHDMALYRQTRTKLNDDVKKVENFFGFEALPEASILIFPVAIKKHISEETQNKLNEFKQPRWQPLKNNRDKLYFGGLESIGCGRCKVSLGGEYFQNKQGE
jgi:CRISPR-associated protein Cmr4